MRLLVVAMLLAVPGTARAEIFVIPFMGVKFGGSTSIVDLELSSDDARFTLGVSALFLGSGIIGFEGDFAHIPSYFESDEVLPLIKKSSYVSDLTGNVVFALPEGVTGGGLRPYVVAGGGLIHAQSEDFLEILIVRRTVPAINLGVGAFGLITNNVGVRFDLRHLRSLTKEDPLGTVGRKIIYSRFTIGLLLRL
jgi:hypothetical protein